MGAEWAALPMLAKVLLGTTAVASTVSAVSTLTQKTPKAPQMPDITPINAPEEVKQVATDKEDLTKKKAALRASMFGTAGGEQGQVLEQGQVGGIRGRLLGN